jgi:hypothetical protein
MAVAASASALAHAMPASITRQVNAITRRTSGIQEFFAEVCSLNTLPVITETGNVPRLKRLPKSKFIIPPYPEIFFSKKLAYQYYSYI